MNLVHWFNHRLHGLLLDYLHISPKSAEETKSLTSINDFAIIILVGSTYN
jgi:hypothetical protein